MQPKVSVVVPIYKVEKYIKDCLDSLVNQTLKEIEVIMINDGTPDNSAKIAQRYADEYKNFKLIHKENGGLADARNMGLKYITGEYVTFLDSDDKLHPKACEMLYRKAKKEDSDIVIGKPVWEYEDGSIKPLDYAEYWFNKESNKNYRNNNRIVVGIPIATSKIFRTGLIKENQIEFPKLIGEDIVFWLYAWHKSKRIHIIPDIVYLRTQRNDENNKSITQRYDINVVKDRLKVLNIVNDYCTVNRLSEIKYNLQHNLRYILNITLNIQNKDEQRKALKKVKEYIDENFEKKNHIRKYIGFSYRELLLVINGEISLDFLEIKYKYKKHAKQILRKIYRKIFKN